MHRVNPSYALNAVRTQAFDGSYQTLHINEREKFIYIYIYIYIFLLRGN
jgi:hypothetical protein